MVPLISDLVFGALAALVIVLVVGSMVFFVYDTVITLLRGRA